MPIYEYQCSSCDHHFDAMQKMSDAPITQCPVCSENTVTKLISAAGFQLKGTGWYATDFKNKGNPNSAAVNSSTATNSDSKTSKKDSNTASEGKGESSKPAATTTISTPKTTSTADK